MSETTRPDANVFDDLVAARLRRRELIGGSFGMAALGFLNGCAVGPAMRSCMCGLTWRRRCSHA